MWAIVGPLTEPGEDDRVSLMTCRAIVLLRRCGFAEAPRRSPRYGSAWIGTYDARTDLRHAGGSWLAIISAGSTKPEWIPRAR